MRDAFVQFYDGHFLHAKENITNVQIAAYDASNCGVVRVGVASNGARFNHYCVSLSDQVCALGRVEHCTSVWGRFALSNQAKNHRLKGRACAALNCAK